MTVLINALCFLSLIASAIALACYGERRENRPER